MAKFRVGYIDMVRGFTMLWVVCLHLELSIGIANDFRMPILFFVSGIFFKIRPFPEFFVRKTNMIFVPLIFFWMITWVCAVLKNEFIPVNFNLSQVDWGSVFSILSKYSYLSITVLWFLMVLYVSNLFFYPLVKYLKRTYVLLFCGVLYLTATYIDNYIQIPLFTLWRFLSYQLFFVLGIYFGRTLLEWIAKNTKQTYIVLIVCLLVFITSQVIDWQAPYFNKVPQRIYNFPPSISLIIMLFWLFSKLEKFKVMEFFRFFGANSLTIYASHMIIVEYLFISLLFPYVSRYVDIEAYRTLYGWFTFFLLCGIGCVFINLFNRYLPQFVGKKDFFKTPESKIKPVIEKPILAVQDIQDNTNCRIPGKN